MKQLYKLEKSRRRWSGGGGGCWWRKEGVDEEEGAADIYTRGGGQEVRTAEIGNGNLTAERRSVGN